MLLCRRLLFKTQIHKALIIVPICSHTLSYHSNRLRANSLGYEPLTEKANSFNIPERAEAVDLINELLNHINNDSRHSPPSPKSLSTTIPSSIGAGAFKSNESAVDIYLRIRHLDRPQLKSLPPAAFVHIARQVFKEKIYTVADLLTEDVVEFFRDDTDNLTRILITILKYACRMPEDQNRRKLMIFKHLPDGLKSNSISKETLVQITRVILRRPQSELTQHVQFLEYAIPILLEQKGDYVLPKIIAQAAYNGDNIPLATKAGEPPPHDAVWLTLHLVHTLTEIEDEERALHIFQILVEAGRIPQQVVEEADAATESFRLVVLSSLIRTCIYSGWWNGAAQLLSKTKVTDNRVASHVSGLAIEIFEAFHNSGTRHDAKNYCDLILALTAPAKRVILPDEQVLIFYDFMRDVRLGHLAEKVYIHLRSDKVRRTREYPHPRGSALPYLMESFIKNSINIHGARTLAQHVVESRERIALVARAPLVRLCALRGFKTEARILWERFAAGREKDAIVGHGSTMLRMVSVFTRDDRRAKHLRSPRNVYYDQKDSGHPKELVDGDEGVDGSSIADALELEVGKIPAANGGGVSFGSPSDYDGTNEFLQLPVTSPVSSPGNKENAETHMHLDDREEYMVFARYIVQEFRKSKLPLENASHMDLNSLARAYGMLDDITSCLGTLKIILDRKEIPDVIDINVALAAMARHDPSRAFSIVLEMIRKGLEPSGVTFATIMHEALALGDRNLAGEIMRTARDLGFGRLTESAVASLLRMNLTAVARKEPFTLPAGETSINVLRRVYYFIMTQPRSMYIHTPSMGKVAIQASLRANQAEMAFDFWKMLLRDHTEWEHAVQVGLRRAIADKIRDHCLAGKLDVHRGRRMVDELGEEVRILEKAEEE